MKQYILNTAIWVLLVLAWASPAEAVCITGNLSYWHELGNYCEVTPSRSCSNWNYTNASQNTNQPLRELIFEVTTTSGGLLATGQTDDQGNYSVCYSPSQTTVVLNVHPEHTGVSQCAERGSYRS